MTTMIQALISRPDCCWLLAFCLLVPVCGARASDESASPLTFYGITLYGTVDVGVTYESHGTPLSDNYAPGLEYPITKNSNHSQFTVAPNGLSNTKLGLSGDEKVVDGWDGVFRLETAIVPTSGRLGDSLQASASNDGVPLTAQKSGGDSSRAGQPFQNAAYIGVKSRSFGGLTFGRQSSLMSDCVNAYDPLPGSSAFSILGYSGITAGIGDSEDARFDNAVKYSYEYGGGRLSALYKFDEGNTEARNAYEFDAGKTYHLVSVDALYNRVTDAVAINPLSAAQVMTAPAGSLFANISDNTSFAFLAKYAPGWGGLFTGYEHIDYSNPSRPVARGSTTENGYVLGVVNNAAFPHTKTLQVMWTGIKYKVSSSLNITAAYYRYIQSSYGLKQCSNTSAATCSGDENAISLVADYRLTKRFDVYAGAMFSSVDGGMASGFLDDSTIDPMIGTRFTF